MGSASTPCAASRTVWQIRCLEALPLPGGTAECDHHLAEARMSVDKPIRAVLFDLDGTLVDSFQGIAATIDAVLVGLAYPTCDRTRLRGLIGAPLETIFRTVLPAVSWKATGEKAVEDRLV